MPWYQTGRLGTHDTGATPVRSLTTPRARNAVQGSCKHLPSFAGMMSESGMQHRALPSRAIAGAALVPLAALVLSSVALAQERSGAPGILTAQEQYQYRYVPPSPQAVRVPQLVGLSVVEAERLLREAR